MTNNLSRSNLDKAESKCPKCGAKLESHLRADHWLWLCGTGYYLPSRTLIVSDKCRCSQLTTTNELLVAVLEQVQDELGIAVHTGLRKAADSRNATIAWEAINELPDGEWEAVLNFVLNGLGVIAALVAAKKAK